MLKLRNHPEIRKLFAEIMAILCFQKKNSYDIPKLNKPILTL